MQTFLPQKVQEAYEQCLEQLQFDERDGAMLRPHVYSLVETEDGWTVFETRYYNDEFIGDVQATSPRYTISIDGGNVTTVTR